MNYPEGFPKVNHAELLKALILWASECDGQNRATANVLQQFPYNEKMLNVLPWEEIDEEVDAAIGVPFDADIAAIVFGDLHKRDEFFGWAVATAERIEKKHVEICNRIFDKLKAEKNLVVAAPCCANCLWSVKRSELGGSEKLGCKMLGRWVCPTDGCKFWES